MLVSVGKGSGLALSGSANLAGLIALREFGQALTDDRCLRGCGRKIRCGGVGDADEILETTYFCHRVWLCPVCSARAARDHRRRLTKTLTAWTAQGGSVAFLTLTQSHSAEDKLGSLWDRQEDGWTTATCGSGWRADRKSFGLRGYVRVTEVVHHPDNGWNVHFHVNLLLDEELDHQRLSQLKDRLTARFVRGIRAAGGQAFFAGQDLRPMDPKSEWRVPDTESTRS